MFRLQSRPTHYALLAAAHLLMTLPNLGAHTLWDMDEGVNAEAAREPASGSDPNASARLRALNTIRFTPVKFARTSSVMSG